MRLSTGARLVLAVAALAGVAGCGGKGEDPGVTVGNLLAYNSPSAPPIPASKHSRDVVCPPVLVADGQASYRLFAGSDRTTAGVKHQFAMGELSRDCDADDSRITIRVGVSGYVQEGPQGGAGSFTVPVKVVVRREADLQPAEVRKYKVAAAIPAGETSAPFSVVTEPISVPFLGVDADNDYTIYVGFDNGEPERPQPARVKRRRG